ncbi:MAG TPA: T9SS type A sorting domain-containing protein [Ignavibacteria bacterium]|jgi:hypothetical protein
MKNQSLKMILMLFLFLILSQKAHTQVQKIDSLQSHDVYNDYNPDLVIPPYIYYPPTLDNSLVYTNVNVSNNPPAPHNEPSVKISRKNPNRVVAAWRDFRISYNPAFRRVGYSYSTNYGATWSASALLDSTLLGSGLLRNSDASVTVDTAGNFYITTIALNNSNGNGTLAIFKSTDGGVTFPIGQILAQGSGEDKEMVTTDLVPGSPYRNNIYISWSRLSLSPDIRLIRSSNAGQSWSAPVFVSSPSTNGQGSDPAVGVNGEVYVVWVSYSYTTQYFNKSTDGGLTFGSPMIIASGTAPFIPFSQSGPTTFPSIAVDVSGGPRNGWIYVTWGDGRNGDADIFLSRSTDHGSTWSAAQRINNDALNNGKVQAWPWIAVNDSGKIAILFYDTRNTPNTSIIEAWLARSDNGGVSFTNEVLSSEQSPTNRPNSDVRFGDYIGNDFWGNKVVPVWTDERAGGYDQEIYSAVVDITTGIEPAVNRIPNNYELEQNYPNPFNAMTTIGFYLDKTSKVTLKVYNELGSEITTLLDGWVDKGKQHVNWYGDNFASGIYFYKMTVQGTESGNFTATRKMILVK